MGNVINISSDAMAHFMDDQNSKKSSNTTFNSKNYLDTRLKEGEDSRTTTIRILPLDAETPAPFSEPVHFHTVRVPKEVSSTGWRSFLCLGSKNKEVDHTKFGSKCPFCEINHTAYDEMEKATDPLLKKNWRDTSLANASKPARICRCIERGKEDEGVKFLKINIRTDGADLYNQIIKLYNDRLAASTAKGNPENIFDLFEGRDLIVTFHAGTAPATVVYDVDKTPLSANEVDIEKWVNDEKKWTDVFTPKSYDYLALVADFRVPYFVKGENGEHGMWVDKEAWEKDKKAAVEETNAEIKNAEKQFMNSVEPAPVVEAKSAPAPAVTTTDAEANAMFVDGTSEGDDLPF